MFRRLLTPILFVALGALLTMPVLGAGSSEKKEPENTAEVAYNKGIEMMKKDDFAGAVKEFSSAVEMQKDFAEAHNNLGYSLRKMGEKYYEKALEHYNHALKLDPKLAAAYHYRGVLYVLIGEEAAAKADFESLVKLDRELADELMKTIGSGEEPEGHGGASWADSGE